MNQVTITLECPDPYVRVQTGECFDIPVLIQNFGQKPFHSSPPEDYVLTYEWFTERGTYFDIAFTTPVDSEILPGDVKTVMLRVYAPLTEGTYTLRITLMQRGHSPIAGRELHAVQVTQDQQRFYALLFKRAIQNGLFSEALDYYKKDREYFGISPATENVSLCRITSVKEWCSRNLLPYITIKKAVKWQIFRPVQTDLSNPRKFEGTVTIPELYVAEVHDATIIGGEDVVLSGKNTALLDDPSPDKILFENGNIFYESPGTLMVRFWIKPGELSFPIIESGIFFCGMFSHNYFHWIVDFLPRLWIIDQCQEYDNLPLIIHDNVPDKFLEALRDLDVRQRAIIRIKCGYPRSVKTLVIPSRFSYYHPQEHSSFVEENVSPVVVDFLREHSRIPQNQAGKWHRRRLYIQRKSPPYRKLLNEKEVEELFKRYGFEFIDPSELSVREQIDIFSDTEIIAGPHGAGWTNMIFAPANARGLMLIGSEITYLYSNIAHIIGQELIHVQGRTLQGEPHKIHFQYDYAMDLEKLEYALGAFCEESPDQPVLPDPGGIGRLDTRDLPELSGRTEFWVDQINREKTSGEPVIISRAAHDQLVVEGWALDRAANAPASAVFLTFDTGQEYRAYYTLPRQDIGEHFKDAGMMYSGFISIIPIEDIPEESRYFRLKIVAHDKKGYFYPQERFSFKIINK